MYPKIFFQSSLPRSGSTIFQNIMGQNPDFYVTPTSGLIELIYGARKNFSDVPEFKAQDREITTKGFSAFCNAGIHAYASALTEKKYFLDKGRSWGIYVDWLEKFMPYQPKIICVVRDLRDIFCSMEILFRKNPELDNGIINWIEMRNTTVAKRIDFFSNTLPIGLAIERLESIIQMGNAHKILFIRFEDLCLRPETEMARVYNYLELPYYNHNFDYIEQLTKEDDTIYTMTDHTIRNKLELPQSKYKDILGEGIADWIYQRYRWFFEYFKYNK